MITKMKDLNRPVFRMAESGDFIDPETGVVTDSDGTRWGTSDALRAEADRLEALRDAGADALFVPAPHEKASSEPTVQGGTLDAMSDGIWHRRNRKDCKA